MAKEFDFSIVSNPSDRNGFTKFQKYMELCDANCKFWQRLTGISNHGS